MTPADATPELTHPLPPAEEPIPLPPPESPVVAESPSVAESPPPAVEPSPVVELPAPTVVAQAVPEVPPAPAAGDLSRIAQDFQIRKGQVEAVVQLLDEGAAVPFIARYRKERTGGLPEELVRRISDRIVEIRAFADRKRTILKSVATHGRLTDEWTADVLAADHPRWLEDLYQPFKPKKKSLAADAKAKGWGNLAEAIWANDAAVSDLPAVVAGMIDPDTSFVTPNDVLTGAKHILAEYVADSAYIRGPVRAFAWDTGMLVAMKVDGLPEDKGREYRDFFEYHEPVRVVPPHRYVAIARGEREKVLVSKIVFDQTKAKDVVVGNLPMLEGHTHREYLLTVIDDALGRLLLPSLEREIRKELTDRAMEQTAHSFARNLRTLLMQPPVRGKRILAIDPGLRTGCKLAALDEAGAVLEFDIIHPHMPQKRVGPAKKKLEYLIRKHQLNVVAIGNGTGCRDTEHLISDLIAEFTDRRINPRPASAPSAVPVAPVAIQTPALESHAVPPVEADLHAVPTQSLDPGMSSPVFSSPMVTGDATVVSTAIGGEASVVTTDTGSGAAVTSTPSAPVEAAAPPPPPEPEIDLTGLPEAPADLCYAIVNEAGAAAYAGGAAARDEFPNLDPVTRGAISIGRRLQDPLAEFVKIDPVQIGPAFHPMDGRPKRFRELLEGVVESTVNHIGVDVNAAGIFLLRNVAGLNQLIAREIVAYRTANGPLRSLDQLKAVTGFTDSRYEQAAGFLTLAGGENPFDETTVHPEQYAAATALLTGLGFTLADLRDPAKRAALDEAFRRANAEEWSKTLAIPAPAVVDLMIALATPLADPRADLPAPVLKTGVLKMEELRTGMELMGTVLNVVPFGAFVDVGVRETGLVHISQMANRYVRSPFDLVAVGDVVPVWVVEIKADEKKLSLTMIPPGSVRKPEDHRPPPRQERSERPERQERPQRDDRPPQQRPAPQQRPTPQPPRDDRGQQGGSGGRSGPPPRPKRFAEPGAWRRVGQPPAAPKQTAPVDSPAAAAPETGKKQKVKAVVKLSGEQKAGKAALNSFGQLFAFIKTRDEGEKPAEAAPDATPPAKAE